MPTEESVLGLLGQKQGTDDDWLYSPEPKKGPKLDHFSQMFGVHGGFCRYIRGPKLGDL